MYGIGKETTLRDSFGIAIAVLTAVLLIGLTEDVRPHALEAADADTVVPVQAVEFELQPVAPVDTPEAPVVFDGRL